MVFFERETFQTGWKHIHLLLPGAFQLTHKIIIIIIIINIINIIITIIYVKVSGDSKGLSFCLKKLILRLWAAQNRPPSNQIPVTHNTNGFQVWSRHTAPPGGQEVQNVSF